MRYQITPNDIKQFKNDNTELLKNLEINTLPLDNEIKMTGIVPANKIFNYTLTINGIEKNIIFSTYKEISNFSNIDERITVMFNRVFGKILKTIKNKGKYILSIKTFEFITNQPHDNTAEYINSIVTLKVDYNLKRIGNNNDN